MDASAYQRNTLQRGLADNRTWPGNAYSTDEDFAAFHDNQLAGRYRRALLSTTCCSGSITSTWMPYPLPGYLFDYSAPASTFSNPNYSQIVQRGTSPLNYQDKP